MISYPPKSSSAWTTDERLAQIAFLARVTSARIDRDDPNMPMLAKGPVREIIVWMERFATWPAESLEAHRALVETPYDDALDHDGIVIVFR